MRLIQHIKRTCSREVFNAHMSGERCLELKLDSLDLDIGDLITFVEVDENLVKTGRTFSRKVIQVEHSSRLDAPKDELDRYGVMAVGLQSPEFNTLRLAFNQRFLMGIVVECTGTSWRPWGFAQCWPLLIAPDLLSTGVLNQLRLDKWPKGVYTIHLMVLYKHDASTQQLEIDIDHALILALCEVPDGSQVEGVELELSALMLGKPIGVFDGEIREPADPESVRDYFQVSDLRKSSLTLLSGELSEEQFREVANNLEPERGR